MSSTWYGMCALRSAMLALTTCSAPLWSETAAELGRSIVLLQSDPHHPGGFLAGTSTAQLFRSSDGGVTWMNLAFPVALKAALHALVVDSQTPGVYLAAVSSEIPSYAGVYRTADEGVTWKQLPGLEQKQVWALAVWSGDPRVLAAGASDGVFLTRDGGETWSCLCSPHSRWPRPVVSLVFDPRNSNILYAGTPHLAWKTVDGGLVWRSIAKGMEEDSDIFAIDVDRTRRSRLFAAACSGIYRSVDGGDTWKSLEQAVGGSHRTYALARLPGRPHVLFAATSAGLLQSTDAGLTWRMLSAELTRSIAFDPADPRAIFLATDQGLRRSQDGGLHFTGLEPSEGLP